MIVVYFRQITLLVQLSLLLGIFWVNRRVHNLYLEAYTGWHWFGCVLGSVIVPLGALYVIGGFICVVWPSLIKER